MDKKLAIENGLKSIKESWSWSKLTEKEQSKFLEFMRDFERYIKGSYDKRCEQITLVYLAFIKALGL